MGCRVAGTAPQVTYLGNKANGALLRRTRPPACSGAAVRRGAAAPKFCMRGFRGPQRTGPTTALRATAPSAAQIPRPSVLRGPVGAERLGALESAIPNGRAPTPATRAAVHLGRSERRGRVTYSVRPRGWSASARGALPRSYNSPQLADAALMGFVFAWNVEAEHLNLGMPQ